MPASGILVGLGNPGVRYAFTRHNFGFLAVDEFLQNAANVTWNVQGACQYARTTYAGRELWAVKPLTFMNLSGLCVGHFVREHNLPVGNMLVVHDDKDLDVGVLRLRMNGGPGGHRGVASLIAELGDSNFYRLRIGVGRPPAGTGTTDYVLEQLDRSLAGDVQEQVRRSAAAIAAFFSDGPVPAMNRYNTREKTPSNQERGISS